MSVERRLDRALYCAVPENIHTPPREGIGISGRKVVGGSVRPKNFKKCMKLNWDFLTGGGS